MALLPLIRSPQAKAWYCAPDSVARDGLQRGWTYPRNTGNQANVLYFARNFAVGAFAGVGAAITPGLRFALPARWGRLRGAVGYVVPPVPP